MKELTIEQKAKAYDEALERMKSLVKGEHPECFTEAQKAAEFIFPELKESEDERIRKELTEFLKKASGGFLDSTIQCKTFRKWCAWLEKQDEKKLKKVSLWKHWKDGIAGSAEGKQIYLTKIGNTYNISSCLSFECDYIELSDLDNLMSKGQCEPNPYSGVSFKYNGHTFGMSARDGGVEVLMDGNLKAFISSDKSFIFPHPTLTPKSALEAAKEEEVDNDQNWVIPYSNPEPEFREGEWVVHNHDICQIVKREEGCNKLVTVFGIEKELVNERNLSTAHLWTIQDAKDGDVLACNGEILLFKSYSVQGRISLYCWYNGQTNNFHNKEVVDVLLTTRNKVCPATKEQRDLLFSKMAEAGYEWNASKKELKKIEDEPENYKQQLMSEITDLVEDYISQKPTWSEKDEKKLSDIISILGGGENCYYNSPILIDWLKSLKERIGG